MAEQKSIELAEIGKVINQARELAMRYRDLTGRPLGITGEVAEYEAARLLGLQLATVRQAGYDAIRTTSSGTHRLQVKGRCVLTKNPGQRIGSIDLDKEGDAVLLVLLDENLQPTAVYEAARAAVENACARRDPKLATSAAR
ncbi:hypothetical protein JI739_19085 [Ramlibacter sp. AW1]|uniref:Uncharacterized protein n=1 Tax=Ramlibacter aurantiacus TaxID=2801330 RepID=A0A936ZWM1_9BURK|nr:hypothetical protein [Ramlibacter aurantiacus]MBL0422460.1 hypothetical protein [Ramlibacter aurantiacus]